MAPLKGEPKGIDRRAKPSDEQVAAGRRRRELHRLCKYFLPNHGPDSFADELTQLAEFARAHPEAEPDRYGSGDFLENFEREVAALLGKEAALFFVSGTMAQQIALRIWCERAGSTRIALHATSHLEKHEHHAYARLHRLESRLLGESQKPFLAADLRNLNPSPAAAALELPYRELGGAAPTWDELHEIRKVAKDLGTKLHLDGARLWEAAPGYGKTPAEIAALFDSVYVSFYKGLGGITGAMLAGDESLIAEARVWQRRHGGNLFTVHPYALSAKLALDQRLTRFPAYYARAREVAKILADEPGLTILGESSERSDKLSSCLFHVRFADFGEGDRDALAEARDRVAAERGTWLFGGFHPDFHGEHTISEITIGEGALVLPDEELRASLRLFGDLKQDKVRRHGFSEGI